MDDVVTILRRMTDKISAPLILRIRVVSSREKSYWYSAHIGEIFEVYRIGDLSILFAGDLFSSRLYWKRPDDYALASDVQRYSMGDVIAVSLFDREDCEVIR